MKNRIRIVYWISTGLFCAMMTASAAILVFKREMRIEEFGALGFPAFVVTLLAIAKPLGVIAILTNLSSDLKQWAYAGFFFNFLLAFVAHLAVRDGDFIAPVVATVLLGASYLSGRNLGRRLPAAP